MWDQFTARSETESFMLRTKILVFLHGQDLFLMFRKVKSKASVPYTRIMQLRVNLRVSSKYTQRLHIKVQ